jgi:hypothetical protein
MTELVGMPLRRLREDEMIECGRKHELWVAAHFEVTKPKMRPALPGPEKRYLCGNCCAERLYNLAQHVEED